MRNSFILSSIMLDCSWVLEKMRISAFSFVMSAAVAKMATDHVFPHRRVVRTEMRGWMSVCVQLFLFMISTWNCWNTSLV